MNKHPTRTKKKVISKEKQENKQIYKCESNEQSLRKSNGIKAIQIFCHTASHA